MDDRELTEWLATNVLGWGDVWRGDEEDCRRFKPLELLDHCRLLEDRLRELGLEDEYHVALVETLRVDGGVVSSIDLIYADARQRCEAVKRTWEQHQQKGSG